MQVQPRSRTKDEAAAGVAASQFGLISRKQAVEAGFDRSAISWRVKSGRWQRVQPGAYAIAGIPQSWEQRLLAAQLSLGGRAVVSHRAAALLWGFLATDSAPVELSVHSSRSPGALDGVIVHRVSSLKGVRKTQGPFELTDPIRTMLDLGLVLGETSLERSLDKGIRLRCFTGSEIYLAADTSTAFRGLQALRKMAALRRPGALTESDLEDLFMRIVHKYQIPVPQKQFPIRILGKPCRLDFAYPERLLAIECDGFSTHADRERFEADRARDRYLVSKGWVVMRFTHRDMTRDEAGVANAVLAQHASRPIVN